MKVVSILTLLAFGAPCVRGSLLAGPPQGLCLYMAYEGAIEVAPNKDPAQAWIAPGCAQLLKRKCTIDELLAFVEFNGKKAWSGNSGIGSDPITDFPDAVDRLSAAGYRGNSDPAKVLPDKWRTSELEHQRTISFGDLFGAIVERYQATRVTAGGFVTDRMTRGMQFAMRQIAILRLQDNARNVILELNKKLAGRGATWQVETYDMEDPSKPGRTFKMLDAGATLALHDGVAAQNLMDAVQDVARDGFVARDAENKGGTGASHQRAYQAAVELLGRLHSGPPGC